MKKLMLIGALGLGGCAEFQAMFTPAPDPLEAAAPAMPPDNAVGTLDPTPPPPPIPEARTVEQFDTTSAADRAEAAAVNREPAGERLLGSTIASLGDPTDPGFWLKTGLVSALTPGRVETRGGASANLELRPSGAEVNAGSQISLPAMRVLDVPLTDLPELTVYATPAAGS